MPANIVWICHYFRWMSRPFLRARACQLVRSTLSSFFAWCQAKVCRSGSKDICTPQKGKQHGFLCFLLLLYLYFYSLSRIIIHVCFCVPSDLEVGYEKSILTRTETFSITICFKEPLLFIILFLKIMCFYLLFISIRTWNYVAINFFVSWPPKTVFAASSVEKSKAITLEKFTFSLLAAEGKSMQWNFRRPL